MKPIIRTALTAAIILPLASCGLFSGKHHPKTKTHTTARTVQPVRISHIDRTQGSQELMLHSMGLIGTPYRWGGSSTSTGFDCSGFMQHIFRNSMGISLPRTSAMQAQMGTMVSRSELQPGDMVFFSTSRGRISHVGLYIGNNRFIHAPRTGKSIEITSLGNKYWNSKYVTARRVKRYDSGRFTR